LSVLRIPVDDCNRFAVRPLKWLRYLGYTIYGREATFVPLLIVLQWTMIHRYMRGRGLTTFTCLSLLSCWSYAHYLLESCSTTTRTSDASECPVVVLDFGTKWELGTTLL
jgi:hypothetical protein